MKDASARDARALPPIRHAVQEDTSSVSGGSQSTHPLRLPQQMRPGLLGPGWVDCRRGAIAGTTVLRLCAAVVHVEKMTHSGKLPRLFVVSALSPSTTGGKGEGNRGRWGTAGFLQQDLMRNVFSV